MDAGIRLWRRLHEVTRLEFIASGRAATGWTGRGCGSVAAESPVENLLIFRESGVWQPAAGAQLQFHNVFRWTKTAHERLELEHLRFGDGTPCICSPWDRAATAAGPR